MVSAMKRQIREQLTYANVVATIAVFIALGGTSYALMLPRDSVGPDQLRANSVGKSEVRRDAIGSSEIDDRSIRLRDVAPRTRRSLRGQTGPRGPQGPGGVTFFAAIDSGGGRHKGNAEGTEGLTVGTRVVRFSRSVADCVATATLAPVPGGATPVPPADGRITVEPSGDGRALIRTWLGNGTADWLPFNLIVAC
jgi:hypothetical protein